MTDLGTLGGIISEARAVNGNWDIVASCPGQADRTGKRRGVSPGTAGSRSSPAGATARPGTPDSAQATFAGGPAAPMPPAATRIPITCGQTPVAPAPATGGRW